MEYTGITKEKARELRRAAYRLEKAKRLKVKEDAKALKRAEKMAALAEMIFPASVLEKIQESNLANAYFTVAKETNYSEHNDS